MGTKFQHPTTLVSGLVVLAVVLMLPGVAVAGEAQSTMSQLELAIQAIGKVAAKSVVTIEVDRTSDVKSNQPATRRPGRTNPWQEMMRQFMQSRVRRTHTEYFKRPNGPVTGFCVSADGRILTSWYNIAGKLKSIKVTLPDGSVKDAKLLGVDRQRDVAMLKVEASGLSYLTPASTKRTKIGSFAVVVSRSANAKRPSVNWGIVSATTRFRNTTLQIDARTNYGNSGAPVLNLRGQLIGTVSQISHWARSGQNSGVSYCASGTYLNQVMKDLAAGKVIKGTKSPYMGIQGRDHNDGVEVTQVMPGGSALKAGMLQGDVIIKFAGKKVSGMQDLVTKIQRLKVGDKVKVVVLRSGKEVEIEMPLGERPEGQ